MRFIRRFLAHLSEALETSVEDIELSGLSTTDPVIVLGVTYALAKQIAGLTKWALDQWKTVEEIRKLRSETAKLEAFNDHEIEAFYGDKIRVQISLGIEAEVAKLVEAVKAEPRANELSNALTIDLREYLGRIERGLTVEVRLIADAHAVGQKPGAADEQENRSISADLKFPPPSGRPVLQITQFGPD